MRVELGVRDVVEIPGANGYTVTAIGFVPTPTQHIPRWDEPIPEKVRPFFPPESGIAVTLLLEWHHFAGEKPALAEYGSTIFVELEPGTVPTEPVNRGPQAPARR